MFHKHVFSNSENTQKSVGTLVGAEVKASPEVQRMEPINYCITFYLWQFFCSYPEYWEDLHSSFVVHCNQVHKLIKKVLWCSIYICVCVCVRIHLENLYREGYWYSEGKIERNNWPHLQNRRVRLGIREDFLTIRNFYNTRTKYQEGCVVVITGSFKGEGLTSSSSLSLPSMLAAPFSCMCGHSAALKGPASVCIINFFIS